MDAELLKLLVGVSMFALIAMAISHVIMERLTVGGVTTDATRTLSNGAGVSLSESIPDSSTDLLIAFVLDVSQCTSFYMKSDKTITIETNSGSSPANTIVLTAGVPYLWYTNKADAFLLTVDVTALYATNSSGAAATLQIEALYDPTV